MTLHVAHDGASMTVPRIDAVKQDGELVYARNPRRELFVVVRTDTGWNADVRYNLRLRAEPPKQGGEVEPNDDTAHAQQLVSDAEGGSGGRAMIESR